MPAIRYRQLEAPAQFDTRIADNGAAAAASSLADALKSFSDTAANVGGEIAKQQGAQEGAIAGAMGKPDYKTGFKQFTAYSQAYNNAATRSYAIHAEADAEDTAARLRVEANNDPGVFRETFGAVMNETLKQAPVQARSALADIYNRHMAEGVSALSAGQATEIRAEQVATLSDGRQRSIDRIARWEASDDPAQHALADEERVKLQLMIDGAQRDGALSSTAAAAAHIDAGRQIVASVVSARFQRELESPHGDPIKFIQRFKKENETNDVLSPEEEDKVTKSLWQDLAEHNRMRSDAAAQTKAEQEARWAAGEREAVHLALTGKLTNKKLDQMVYADQSLDPKYGKTLSNELESEAASGGKKSDPQALATAKINLLNYSDMDILKLRDIAPLDKAALIEERDRRANGWESQQSARNARDRIGLSLHMLPGVDNSMATEPTKRAYETAYNQWYDAMNATPPAEREVKALPLALEAIKNVVVDNAQIKLEGMVKRRNESAAAWAASGPHNKGEEAEHAKVMSTADAAIRAQELKAKQ